jgi:hypothetical protein
MELNGRRIIILRPFSFYFYVKSFIVPNSLLYRFVLEPWMVLLSKKVGASQAAISMAADGIFQKLTIPHQKLREILRVW